MSPRLVGASEVEDQYPRISFRGMIKECRFEPDHPRNLLKSRC